MSKTPVPSKIIGIEVINYDKMEYVVDVLNKNGYNVQLYLNEIEPIPLTPELLEKNGFESQHNVGYVLEYYDDNTIIVDLWNHILKVLVNYKVVFEKEYFDTIPLNELQHALKLCGIKKEIVL